MASRTAELARKAADKLAGGESERKVLKWLSGQSGFVAGMARPDSGLWFRLEEGQKTMVWPGDDYVMPSPDILDSSTGTGSLRQRRQGLKDQGDVVHESREKQKQKNAFIYAPFDEPNPMGYGLSHPSGRRARDVLGKIREYDVDFETADGGLAWVASSPPWDLFRDWRRHDVVHMAVHGKQFCCGENGTIFAATGDKGVVFDSVVPENAAAAQKCRRLMQRPCTTALWIGGRWTSKRHFRNASVTGSMAVFTKKRNLQSWGRWLNTERFSRCAEVFGKKRCESLLREASNPRDDYFGSLMAINADFFRENYPAPVSHTLFTFATCNTLARGTTNSGTLNSDIAEILTGEGSIYLGNTGAQDAHDNARASEFIYRKSGPEGWPVHQAWNEARERGHDTRNNSVRVEAFPLARPGLYIREIVELQDPGGNRLRGPLLGGTTRSLIEGQLEDGEPDALKVIAEVDGRIPQPFRAKTKLFVRLKSGGESVEKLWPLDDFERKAKDLYRLADGRMKLRVDASELLPADSLRAELRLPGEGESIHEVGALRLDRVGAPACEKHTAEGVTHLGSCEIYDTNDPNDPKPWCSARLHKRYWLHGRQPASVVEKARKAAKADCNNRPHFGGTSHETNFTNAGTVGTKECDPTGTRDPSIKAVECSCRKETEFEGMFSRLCGRYATDSPFGACTAQCTGW